MRIREELRPEQQRTPGLLESLVAKMEVIATLHVFFVCSALMSLTTALLRHYVGKCFMSLFAIACFLMCPSLNRLPKDHTSHAYRVQQQQQQQ
jgi:hypothetical protein